MHPALGRFEASGSDPVCAVRNTDLDEVHTHYNDFRKTARKQNVRRKLDLKHTYALVLGHLAGDSAGPIDHLAVSITLLANAAEKEKS